MGCTVREKHVRTNRRTRSARYDIDSCCVLDKAFISKSVLESGIIKPFNNHLGCSNQSTPQNPSNNNNDNLNACPQSSCEDSGCGYCTEEQLEEILLKNLEFLYNEAISRLVALGYDEETALKAILRNGHCYGGMDVLTNILHNALAYLNGGSGGSSTDGNSSDEFEPVFADLKHLEEYSLAGMVCLLQQVRPLLSKGDAMWCLLMSDLHVGRASTMEIPVLPSSGGNAGGAAASGAADNVGTGSNSVGVVSPVLCRFHSGWGFGNGGDSESPIHGFFSNGGELTLQREIECPKRFNLSPSMKTLLSRNVAMFAAGFRANSKRFQPQAEACSNTLASGTALVGSGAEVPAEQCEEPRNSKNQDAVNSVLSKFRNLNLDENSELVAEDQKDEMIVTLLHQIKELERQVKERKDWAHQKAMQAARKLSNDLRELKLLRMEREETQRLKKGKQTLEDTTMKRLSEMENALRKASGQVDRANAAVKRLETENAEIRAEMEASKLSAAESVTTCLELAKKEKRCLKRLLAWEKQKARLQEEIKDEREKISQVQQALSRIKQSHKETELKWRQELKAKELASAQLEEERCLKEAAEASNKRKLEALRLKIEIDFQRHKDDLLRLEQELSRLKASSQYTESHQPSNALSTGSFEGAKPQGETIAKLLRELDNLEDSSDKEANSDRECIVCLKDEVSVVFLPCAHQVMCAGCSDDFGLKGKPTCPCCRVPVEQKIRVFGASS
ncbi:43kDa postsynaptic protein [Parasponia andersonii]|uniref:43kDa postsynaptic protein n=1 Tax=Parasponia andersonii TaxID=3476 RepID=A0A2P5C7L1_PARAD|nr:43kDa postsynaptic protein [Parasponia andersonii]